MNLDLFRLRVFVTVVDRNGYSAAARLLNLAQPTVSHHVSELERACGTELLHYRTRAVHLTEAGQEIYRTALVMLAEQDRLADSLGDIKKGRGGRIRLGASMSFEQRYFFEHVIAPFRRAHDGTLLSLRFGHSRREAQAVLDRELDLAYVIRWHLPADAVFEPLQQVRLTFFASPGHRLAGRGSVTAAGILTTTGLACSRPLSSPSRPPSPAPQQRASPVVSRTQVCAPPVATAATPIITGVAGVLRTIGPPDPVWPRWSSPQHHAA